MADRQGPRLGRDEHVRDVAEDPSLELWRPRNEFATALQGLIHQWHRLRIVQQPPRARFPIEGVDSGPLVILALEMLSSHRQVQEGFFWLDQPAVRLAKIEMHQGCVVATPLLREQREAELD